MKAVFIFSGQGAQSVGMGRDLYEKNEAARKIFNEADTALSWQVSPLCFNGPEEKLTESRYCQPAIYTMSAVCLESFRSKYPDVKPIGAAGLSLGEFAALFSVGVFSFSEGLKIVARRGELMDEACRENDGAMASVLNGDVDAIKSVCSECGVDVANYNCPGQVVISGVRSGIESAVQKLKEKGIGKIIPLKVAGAYHSRLMAGAGRKFGEFISSVELKAPVLPVAQNFAGKTIDNPAEIKNNLVSQVAGSVRWEECVRHFMSMGADTLIEFGPGAVLTGLARRIDKGLKTYNINSTESLEKFADFSAQA